MHLYFGNFPIWLGSHYISDWSLFFFCFVFLLYNVTKKNQDWSQFCVCVMFMGQVIKHLVEQDFDWGKTCCTCTYRSTCNVFLDWLLFNVPVNNFSVMLGRSHSIQGIYQYFGELKVSCSRTLHGGLGVRTLDLSLRSPKLHH